MKRVIGVNSGSSFDGVDAALIEMDLAGDGHPTRPTFIDGITMDWPVVVGEKVILAFENKLDIFKLCRLNYEAGAVYATAVKTIMDKHNLKPEDIEVIGLDGQTLYQEPTNYEQVLTDRVTGRDADWVARWANGPYPCGLQIGDSSVIAGLTGVTAVTHFRAADHVFGGTGAPLMQYLDFVAFRDIGPVLTLNIGGIANCHLADRDRAKMIAFDTGPGNVIIDFAAKKFFGKKYDPDGQFAAKGKVNEMMLADLKDHPYFTRKPPRCAWRLDFGSEYAASIIAKYASQPQEDIMATLTRFTAYSIGLSIREYIPDNDRVKELIASGGGVRNATLVKMIQEELPPSINLVLSDKYGVPAPFKEAIKFGALAFAAINHLANNIPACSGAERYNIMGRIALSPRLAIVDPKK
jgi:anhydro-N-acetylmuramic acid kinase